MKTVVGGGERKKKNSKDSLALFEIGHNYPAAVKVIFHIALPNIGVDFYALELNK
jgi:hypothetical protein